MTAHQYMHTADRQRSLFNSFCRCSALPGCSRKAVPISLALFLGTEALTMCNHLTLRALFSWKQPQKADDEHLIRCDKKMWRALAVVLLHQAETFRNNHQHDCGASKEKRRDKGTNHAAGTEGSGSFTGVVDDAQEHICPSDVGDLYNNTGIAVRHLCHLQSQTSPFFFVLFYKSLKLIALSVILHNEHFTCLGISFRWSSPLIIQNLSCPWV